jgi:hypothetical protein
LENGGIYMQQPTSERQTERDDEVSEDANVGRRFSAILA